MLRNRLRYSLGLGLLALSLMGCQSTRYERESTSDNVQLAGEPCEGGTFVTDRLFPFETLPDGTVRLDFQTGGEVESDTTHATGDWNSKEGFYESWDRTIGSRFVLRDIRNLPPDTWLVPEEFPGRHLHQETLHYRDRNGNWTGDSLVDIDEEFDSPDIELCYDPNPEDPGRQEVARWYSRSVER